MTKPMRFAFTAALAILVLAAPAAFGQINNFTLTSLSSAQAMGSRTACLTSATGVVLASNAAAGSFLFVDGEQEQVRAVSDYSASCFIVTRVAGSPIAHASGAPVFIGPGNWFQKMDAPVGTSCTLAYQSGYPWINPTDGKVFYCLNSMWVDGDSFTVAVTSAFSATSGGTADTLTSVTGLAAPVRPGTYRFRLNLPGTANGSGGIKAAFKLTSAVLTSIDATGRAFTASAVAVQHTTTTTDPALLIASTAAVISTEIEGTMVVGTGGTITLQAAQNASNAGATALYAGGTMTFTRM